MGKKLWSKLFGADELAERNRRGDDRRRSYRRQSAVMTCEIGQIVEVSRHGLRVRSQRRPGLTPGTEVDLELCAPTDAMTTRARVVRVEALKGGRFDVSFDFIGLSEEDRVAVEGLSVHGKRHGATGVLKDESTRERLIAALKMPDYYELFGLKPGASVEEVQAAYRGLARRFHPDVCKESGAEKRFSLINEAHEVLRDEAKRREYDGLYALRRAA